MATPEQDIALTDDDRYELMSGIAAAFRRPGDAERLLMTIRFPAAHMPNFATMDTTQVWNSVFIELESGILQPAPYRTILMAALRVYQDHPILRPLAERHKLVQTGRPVGTDQASAPARAKPAVVIPATPPSCHVIVRASTDQERRHAVRALRNAGLEPREVWSTLTGAAYRVAIDEPGGVRQRLLSADFEWAVVAPDEPSYLYRDLYTVMYDASGAEEGQAGGNEPGARDGGDRGHGERTPATTAIGVHVLAASPRDRPLLRVSSELRGIWTASKYRHIAVTLNPASTLLDLQEVLTTRPSILHLSAHCESGCLILEDSYGDAEKVPVADLVGRLSTYRDYAGLHLSGIVLNCCDSGGIAELFRPVADVVVAHDGPLDDGCAIAFAQELYITLNQVPRLAGAAPIAADTVSRATGSCARLSANLLVTGGVAR